MFARMWTWRGCIVFPLVARCTSDFAPPVRLSYCRLTRMERSSTRSVGSDYVHILQATKMALDLDREVYKQFNFSAQFNFLVPDSLCSEGSVPMSSAKVSLSQPERFCAPPAGRKRRSLRRCLAESVCNI